MPSHAVEPGTRVVDRYLLQEYLGSADRTSYWRALDELLDRSVGLCLIPLDDPRAALLLEAARRAAVLTDLRFLRILDASAADDVVYVVTEWVGATNLAGLLADGPLPPAEARALALDIAEALDSAHAAGLAHLCLTPDHVLRAGHGDTKLGGLGIDAAVLGLRSGAEDAAALDTFGAAAVAYAALTARWPGSAPTRLAPAPRDGGALCSPRQVRAGIPPELDAVLCRALGIPGDHGPALRTPRALADALTGLSLPSREPEGSGTGGFGTVTGGEDGRPRRSSAATLAWAAAILVLFVGLGLAVSQLAVALWSQATPDSASSSSPASPRGGTSSSSSPPPGKVIAIQRVTSYDPPPEGTGDENEYAVGRVVDGNPVTVWTTKKYNNPFGPQGLKTGVGLVLDLGSPTRVGSVTVQTSGGATDVEIRTSDTIAAAAGDFQLVGDGPTRNIDGRATVSVTDDRTARYVLVWLTALPLDGAGYRGQIAEVSVRG